ncbi:hypothetical protein [Azospirillum baldaniorum]|uniref:hypothetical protein n=1 Tax=Azospirillum baldaniorum TaxID=1064539 RepID=UPI0011A7609B|nr:hypothetical protein [Azospirillum baldaniorum]
MGRDSTITAIVRQRDGSNLKIEHSFAPFGQMDSAITTPHRTVRVGEFHPVALHHPEAGRVVGTRSARWKPGWSSAPSRTSVSSASITVKAA